jgi:hypothetical protein
MKRIYFRKDLKEILHGIVNRKYDLNFASTLAADFFFEENPDIEFSEDFSNQYELLMDYFLHAPTEKEYAKSFKRVVTDLISALNQGDVMKEDLIYILYKEEIKKLENLYKEKKISAQVFKRQVSKLGDGNFDFDRLVMVYFGV